MLSQTATYALQAMAFLATHKDEGPILSQTISEEMKIPKNFLSKILNRLVQEFPAIGPPSDEGDVHDGSVCI